MPELARSIYRGLNPVDVPLYSPSDVARYLRIPATCISHADQSTVTFRSLVQLFLSSVPDDEEVSALYQERVEYEDGDPVRFYPFTRHSMQANSPRIIAIDPRYGFGKPMFAANGIRIDAIVGRFRAGESVAALAKDCGIHKKLIEEAIRFEFIFVK